MVDLKDSLKDEAFGIIPILATNGKHEYLLIQHHAGHWGFPKGHADPGETPVEAACREFAEETGIVDYSLIEAVSFSERYGFTREGQRFAKTVVYFPAFVHAAEVNCQPEEIQNYCWANYEQAIATLTFSGAKQVLTAVHDYLNSPPHPIQP